MRGVSGIVVGLFLLGASAASAQFTRNDVDCSGLKLVAATGVPQDPTHSYKFHGICKIIRISSVAKEIAGYHYDDRTSVELLGTVWADLAASWNSQTGYFKEQTKTQGAYPGEIAMQLRCTADPVIWNALLKPPCQPMGYKNTTGWNGFDRVYAVPRPISQGKTTPSQAAAMSQQAASTSSNPPPPPPPAPEPQPSPSPTPTSAPPTIPRATASAGSGTVAIASPQIVVAPTRATPAPAPSPSPPPPSAGEIGLAPGVRIELQDGRAVAADDGEGGLRWALLNPKGKLLRRFPPGAKLIDKGKHGLVLEWPGGSYHAGKQAGQGNQKGH